MARLEDYDVSNPFQGTVVKTERLTPQSSDVDIHELVLKVDSDHFDFESGQSVGVLAPGSADFGNEHHFRLYTVAGKDDAEKILHICVKRCFYIDEFNGERYAGVASNYLCDLAQGDEITMTGPYGIPFSLPEDNSADILMIGMGTGIAPFRAFIKHLYETKGGWKGNVRLFYGAKSGIELVYMNQHKNDFEHYYDEATFKAFEAVSPKPYFDEPIALEDTLAKNQEEVWSMILNPETHVYVAGLSKVKEMLDSAFTKMAGSETKWERRLAELKAGGRWQEVIY